MSLFEKRLLRAEARGLGSKLWRVSWIYVLLLCLLSAVGYVALYSAAGGSIRPYAGGHVLRFGFALLLMLGVAMVDIRFIARLAWLGYAAGVVLLAAVLRFGHVGNGARRWLAIGSFQWQPSEMMKIVLVLALAAWFRRASWERMGNPLFLIPPALAVLLPVALILKEPNLGTAVITATIGGTVFLGAGLRWWKVALLAGLLAIAAPIVYHHLHAYQKSRIEIFLHPERDPLGAGYNIIQSKIALGSGGVWGKGYLHGTQGRLDFLPEKQTDFIFTLLAEQFGLVGSYAVLGLLMLITFWGLYIGLRCQHQFGRLVALGLSTNFFCYVFVNLAMVMGLIPVGGVPLPLVSHGGSAMLMVMIGCGILMSVHVHRDAEFDDAAETG
ncbi:MAG: rod shape-determining protein RodA [Rhodospirillales bacterium]|nr:rod shape-determining protein RodA [Rhodospirillales bacterium]